MFEGLQAGAGFYMSQAIRRLFFGTDRNKFIVTVNYCDFVALEKGTQPLTFSGNPSISFAWDALWNFFLQQQVSFFIRCVNGRELEAARPQVAASKYAKWLLVGRDSALTEDARQVVPFADLYERLSIHLPRSSDWEDRAYSHHRRLPRAAGDPHYNQYLCQQFGLDATSKDQKVLVVRLQGGLFKQRLTPYGSASEDQVYDAYLKSREIGQIRKLILTAYKAGWPVVIRLEEPDQEDEEMVPHLLNRGCIPFNSVIRGAAEIKKRYPRARLINPSMLTHPRSFDVTKLLKDLPCGP